MTRGTHSNHARADRQHRWAADRKILTAAGHVKVRVGKGHPLADPNGYAYEHLVVWVAAGRDRPTASMLLHHRNGVKSDNRIENLELVTRSEHNRIHARPRDSVTGRLLAGSLLDGVEHKAMPEERA